MKANELRIGNLVSNNSVVLPVVLIGYDSIVLGKGNIYSAIKIVEPIPLDEEWLVKAVR